MPITEENADSCKSLLPYALRRYASGIQAGWGCRIDRIVIMAGAKLTGLLWAVLGCQGGSCRAILHLECRIAASSGDLRLPLAARRHRRAVRGVPRHSPTGWLRCLFAFRRGRALGTRRLSVDRAKSDSGDRRGVEELQSHRFEEVRCHLLFIACDRECLNSRRRSPG